MKGTEKKSERISAYLLFFAGEGRDIHDKSAGVISMLFIHSLIHL